MSDIDSQFGDFVVDEATVPEALPKVPHPAGIAVQDAALQEVPDREVDEGAQVARQNADRLRKEERSFFMAILSRL